MTIQHLNCLEVPNGVYYIEETDNIILLENKTFKIGMYEGQPSSCHLYDFTSVEGSELQVIVPNPIIEPVFLGEL